MRTIHFKSPISGVFWLRSIVVARWAAYAVVCVGSFFLAAGAARAHESPVDHVERELRLTVEEGQLRLSYRMQQSERAVLMQLHQMDANGDGVISDAERETFFAAQAGQIAALFTFELDSQPLKFAPLGPVRRDARLGQTFVFAAPLGVLKPGRRPGHLIDGFSRAYPGPFRWLGAGEGNQKMTHVEPVVLPENAQGSPHPAYLELKFEVVTPPETVEQKATVAQPPDSKTPASISTHQP